MAEITFNKADQARIPYDEMMKEIGIAAKKHLGSLLDQIEVPDLAEQMGISPTQLARRLRLMEIPIKLMRSPRTHRITNFISKADALKIIEEGV